MPQSPNWAGLLDGHLAVRYSMSECWVWVAARRRGQGPGRWVKGDMLDCFNNCSAVTEAEFTRLFPEVPAVLPRGAFAAD
jgi:hypothetical protein